MANDIDRALAAIALLSPIIKDVAEYIGGGRRSRAITSLPKELRSEIELARLENRKA